MGGRADDALAAQREVLFGTVAFQMILAVEQPLHDGVNGLVGGAAHHGVHFGDLLLDLAAVALGQAPGDHDLQVRVLLLVGARLKDVLNGLGLGALDETAGVDEDDIGFAQLRHRLVAGGQQDVDHAVQIDLILRAAKGNTCNFHKGDILSFYSSSTFLMASLITAYANPRRIRAATTRSRRPASSFLR